MLNQDRDEELSMFLEMRRREKEHRGESLLTGSSYIYITYILISICVCLGNGVWILFCLFLGSDNVSINGALTTAVSTALSGISSETVSSQRYSLRRTAAENFLYSENEKSDYDW